MRTERWIFAALASLLAALPAWADGDGLAARAENVPWTHLAGRLSYDTSTPAWRTSLAPTSPGGLRLHSLSILGDLYTGSSAAGLRATPSGFRATSGLLIGTRSQPWGAAPVTPSGGPAALERRATGATTLPYTGSDAALENATVPYLGFGYSAFSMKSGWSFSADLGVMSLNPGGAVRLGRGGSSAGLDDLVRDMRLAPVLQLGVSYSF